MICVREDHTDKSNVRNALVRLPLPQGGAGEVLYGDSDFVSYPRVSPDGRKLAFIAWNHPRMPWDGTELKVATLSARGIDAPINVAGSTQESVLEPQWDVNGDLYFISDRSGYWNLYSWRDGRAHVGNFLAPLRRLNREQSLERVRLHVQTLGVQVFRFRQIADRRLDRRHLSGAALEHPLERGEVRARVVAKVAHQVLLRLALVIFVPAGVEDQDVTIANLGS